VLPHRKFVPIEDETELLKITGGNLKGRRLKTLKGFQTRPTLEKTRQAMFNTLSSRYDLKAFEAFDLFAGSGALGFEAVSRGAVKATFLDRDPACIAVIKANAEALQLQTDCQIICQETIRWLKQQAWDRRPRLFLVDPPYNTPLAQGVVDLLALYAPVLSDSILMLETAITARLGTPPVYRLIRDKCFGHTRLTLLEMSCQESV